MKKNFQYYLGIWVVLLIVYNIVAFAFQAGPGEFTAGFWIGYVFILIAFCGQLVCARMAFREENIQKLFYHLPLITVSYTTLIISFIFGAVCALISGIPYWIEIVISVIILAAAVISIIKAEAAAEIVSSKDEKIKRQTLFIKSFTVDVETLMSRAKSKDAKLGEYVSKVYETARYSDPVSDETLAAIESQITITFSSLEDAVDKGDGDAVKKAADEIVILLNDRNKKCKLLK